MDKKYYWFIETDEIGELINAGLVKLWFAGENTNGTSKLSTDINKAVALSQDEILDRVGSDLECYWRHELADPGAIGNRGKPGAEKVNNPSHYNENGLETIDAIKGTMSREAFHGFCTGNILKYVARFKFKNGIEDLKKARWYLDKMIEDEERGENNALK